MARITLRERVSIRRMMSRYWNNHSTFGIDLVGAVIRQGTFIEKMHNIGWLFSPAVLSTADRLVQKYQNFFKIMADNPRKMAVPTLDVDLAWHTHQTAPLRYYKHSVEACNGVFIDHDDKVDEAKLDEAFEWTSKTYQRLFGTPYSECTCWYCEAIREAHTSPLSRLFKTANASATSMLHQSGGGGSCDDPATGPHISSHNSVRTSNTWAWSAARRAHLDKAFAAAARRAKKEGREPPRRDEYYATAGAAYDRDHHQRGKERDGRAGAYAACAPFVGYAAYGAFPLGAVGYYGGDPGYAETGSGVSGGCCQGTCGGMIGAGGACAGVGGACGGGGCGGVGGGGGGGCGGAGGCGGGGGGCGGGGGGGGGGCGGGGGGGGGC